MEKGGSLFCINPKDKTRIKMVRNIRKAGLTQPRESKFPTVRKFKY